MIFSIQTPKIELMHKNNQISTNNLLPTINNIMSLEFKEAHQTQKKLMKNLKEK